MSVKANHTVVSRVKPVDVRKEVIQQFGYVVVGVYFTFGLIWWSKHGMGGSIAEWLACWTQAQKGPGSNRSRDAVG